MTDQQQCLCAFAQRSLPVPLLVYRTCCSQYCCLTGASAGPHIDGGKVDRTALKAWREERRQNVGPLPWAKQPPHALIHLVDRSSQMSGADDVEATGEPYCWLCTSHCHAVNAPVSKQLHCA